MPELDPLDARLTAAVRSFADRAETTVDASAMAAQVAGRRRHATLAWFAAPPPAAASILLAAGLVLVLLSSVALVGAPWDRLGRLILPPAPPSTSMTPAPTATPLPTVTPQPSPDGAAAGHTTGTIKLSVVNEGTSRVVGDVTQVRGRELATVSSTRDPQVTGAGTLLVSVDLHGAVGPLWGTYHLANADGAWDGACAGASWDGGDAVDLACWLVGSGAYEGSTYHLNAQGTDVLGVEGTVIPGSPPGP